MPTKRSLCSPIWCSLFYDFSFFSQTVCCGGLRVGSVVVGHGVRFLEKVMGGEKVTGNGKLDWCKKERLIAGDLSHGVGECIVVLL